MMKSILNKLRSQCGESLVESLCAILIFTFASIVMYSMVTSAANINGEVKAMDENHQEQMVFVEQAEASHYYKTGMATFTITGMDGRTDNVSIPIDVYGGENDTLFAYYTHTEEITGG